MDPMKRLSHVILALALAGSVAYPATVVFNLVDFITDTQGLRRRPFMIERLTAVSGNTTNVVTGERRVWNIGTNGIVTATNMLAGLYQCRVLGLSHTSVFRINVIDTNGTLTASHIITSSSSSAIDTEEGIPIDFE